MVDDYSGVSGWRGGRGIAAAAEAAKALRPKNRTDGPKRIPGCRRRRSKTKTKKERWLVWAISSSPIGRNNDDDDAEAEVRGAVLPPPVPFLPSLCTPHLAVAKRVCKVTAAASLDLKESRNRGAPTEETFLAAFTSPSSSVRPKTTTTTSSSTSVGIFSRVVTSLPSGGSTRT